MGDNDRGLIYIIPSGRKVGAGRCVGRLVRALLS